MNYDPRLKTYIKVDNTGRAVLGSAVRRYRPPSYGRWRDITNCLGDCCFSPVYMIICNTNSDGQIITNIAYGSTSLDVSIEEGQCYTIELPLGGSTVTVTNDASSDPGRMTSGTVTGSGTITPSCDEGENSYVFVIEDAHAGDQFIATLETTLSCTTSTTTTSTTTLP